MVFSFIFIFLGSCSDDFIANENEITNNSLILNKSEVQNSTLSNQQAYKEFHLTSLMSTVLEVNSDFENSEEFKSSKKDRHPINVETLLKKSLTSKNQYHPSFDAFRGLDGETWYPI